MANRARSLANLLMEFSRSPRRNGSAVGEGQMTLNQHVEWRKAKMKKVMRTRDMVVHARLQTSFTITDHCVV